MTDRDEPTALDWAMATAARLGVDSLEVQAAFPSPTIICEPDPTCRDANVNRWYCMKGREGAAPGVCPLKRCGGAGIDITREARQ